MAITQNSPRYSALSSPAHGEVSSGLGIVQLVHSWSVAYKTQRSIRVLYHKVLMFDELLRISQASVVAKVFDSQSFVPGSHPSSFVVGMHY